MSLFSDLSSAVGLNFDTSNLDISGALGGDPYTTATNIVSDQISGSGSILGDIFGSDSGDGGPDVLNDGTNTSGVVDRMRGGHDARGIWLPGAQGESGFVRTGGLPAGLMALGAYLARRFGAAGAASAAVKIGNKVFRLGALRGYIDKYGASAVATALGISLGALGRLLLEAPAHKKRRRRGLTWRQLNNARRTCKVLRNMQHHMGSCAPHRSYRRTSSRGSTIIAQR